MVGLPNLDRVVRVEAEAPEDCLVRRTNLANRDFSDGKLHKSLISLTSLFTESALRPIQSSGVDVRECLCLSPLLVIVDYTQMV